LQRLGFLAEQLITPAAHWHCSAKAVPTNSRIDKPAKGTMFLSPVFFIHEPMDKKELIRQLNDLAEHETHPFKKKAYAKASQKIADLSAVEFQTRTRFNDLEGIGEAIDKKILQFKETGFIKKWQELFGN
jgi:hypothetical protein